MQTPRALLLVLAASLGLTGCVRRPCDPPTTLGIAGPLLDAHFSVASCCGGPRYVWTGTSCVETQSQALCGCSCTGADCDKVFSSLEECQRAYGHCG